MSKQQDGGPAFPVSYESIKEAIVGSGGELQFGQGGGLLGMTLRDWFAGQALSLFYWARPEPKTGESGQDAIARMAYSVADAMLKAREE